jgi:hypothetical protein
MIRFTNVCFHSGPYRVKKKRGVVIKLTFTTSFFLSLQLEIHLQNKRKKTKTMKGSIVKKITVLIGNGKMLQ